MVLFKQLEGNLTSLADNLLRFKPQVIENNENEWKEAESDASYVKNFAKIGSFLEKKFTKLSQGFIRWKNTAKWVIDPKEYSKICKEESHYKEKLLKLIQDIEEKREEKKIIKKKDFEKLQRVKINTFLKILNPLEY